METFFTSEVWNIYNIKICFYTKTFNIIFEISIQYKVSLVKPSTSLIHGLRISLFHLKYLTIFALVFFPVFFVAFPRLFKLSFVSHPFYVLFPLLTTVLHSSILSQILEILISSITYLFLIQSALIYILLRQLWIPSQNTLVCF